MVINIGGLWDRPIPMADERPCSLPSVYTDIVCTESFEGYDLAGCISCNCLSPETNMQGSHAEYSFRGSGVTNVDEEEICSKEQPKSSSMMKQYAEVSTESEREKGHVRGVDVHKSENTICRHASKALRVRSSAAKDRHSKVNTAKGLRDTRVRLSLSTAVKFYEVQYRLGLDRPSKALDWLMSKAQSAIDQLPEASYISKFNCSLCSSVSKTRSTSLPTDRVISTYSEQATNVAATEGAVDARRSGGGVKVPVSKLHLISPKDVTSAFSSSSSSGVECFKPQSAQNTQPW